MEREDGTAHRPGDEHLAALILENAVEYAIFTLDLTGRIQSWSPGAVRIFGYSAEEAIGAHFTRLFAEPDRLSGAAQLEIERALANGRAEDTRWHIRKNGERFWANGVTMAIPGLKPPMLLKITRDETPAKRAEDQRVLLLNELNHRIKNTLSIVQSIAENSLRRVDPGIRDSFIQRIVALSDAHNVLVNESWAGADLRAIIETALAPHGRNDAFTLEGPPVRLSSQQAVALAMALHELNTNALKYGALTASEGEVIVSWNLAQSSEGARELTLSWRERNGPPAKAPGSQGFGTRLLTALFGQDGGRADWSWSSEGLAFAGIMPLSDPDGRTLSVGAAEGPA